MRCIICNTDITWMKSKIVKYCSYRCRTQAKRLRPEKVRLSFCVDCNTTLSGKAISRCANCYSKAVKEGREAWNNPLQYKRLGIWKRDSNIMLKKMIHTLNFSN